jgi:hypothetical protein
MKKVMLVVGTGIWVDPNACPRDYTSNKNFCLPLHLINICPTSKLNAYEKKKCKKFSKKLLS